MQKHLCKKSFSDSHMDVVNHNRNSWNIQSKSGSRWCEPVSAGEVESARRGDWNVELTPNKAVPLEWFGALEGRKVLCLASGGGQQSPILAAAGAEVVSFDLSDEQLAKDTFVAKRDALNLVTIQGDMANMSVLGDETFDVIFHPVSNVFVEDIAPVWKECLRVLKWGGRLLSGFMNPSFFLFDHDEMDRSGQINVRYALPFSDLKDLDKEERNRLVKDDRALEFGHTLEEQIGGQIRAGFIIAGLYEDDWDDESTKLNRFTSTFIATLAIKQSTQDS